MRVNYCIIDNDTRPSARDIVVKAAADFPQPLRYVNEPTPGIPSARNRALSEAGSQGYLAFVDDDETVDSKWLLELHRVAKVTGAQFVQGPVQMLVDDQADQWWLDTALFRQKSFPDLSARHESWSNNVLIDMAFVTRTGCRFDDVLRFDGGSDTLFFHDICRSGGRGAFAASAMVFEVQPKSRLTWRWTIQRQYRYGITRANVATLRKSWPRAALYCLVRSAAMAGWGMACFVTTLTRGRRGVADGVAFLARGAGVLLGAAGAKRREYARFEAKS